MEKWCVYWVHVPRHAGPIPTSIHTMPTFLKQWILAVCVCTQLCSPHTAMNEAICSDSMQPNDSQLTRSCNAPAHIHNHVTTERILHYIIVECVKPQGNDIHETVLPTPAWLMRHSYIGTLCNQWLCMLACKRIPTHSIWNAPFISAYSFKVYRTYCGRISYRMASVQSICGLHRVLTENVENAITGHSPKWHQTQLSA